MKSFMDEDFLLNSETAKVLYHEYAEKLPIIDYHCHINPREIYEDVRFENITQVWLSGDHYKWRLLRANGVSEEFVTGNASDHDKFIRFAETLERCIGNPVHQWSHLELKRYFGITKPLNSETAEEIWDETRKKLAKSEYSARGIMKMSNVELICTTDDPADSLEWHSKIAADKEFGIRVLPTWRPDRAVNIEKPDFKDYVAKLAAVAGVKICRYEDLKAALVNRLEFFADHGCKLADQGLEFVPCVKCTEEEAADIFSRAMAGEAVSAEEILKYKTSILVFLGAEYAKRNWTMQLHYGCKRNNNTRMFKAIGADTGYDCILNAVSGAGLADYLDALEETESLPKTIIYSLDPNDNAMIETVMGCFQGTTAIGKIQHGSAWWFNDNKAGMEAQMHSLANEGVLGNFVGMLTDSRSFLSYTRHEYFRRIMCNLVAEYVENGEYAWDEKLLGKLVKDISHDNAKRYFRF